MTQDSVTSVAFTVRHKDLQPSAEQLIRGLARRFEEVMLSYMAGHNSEVFEALDDIYDWYETDKEETPIETIPETAQEELIRALRKVQYA